MAYEIAANDLQWRARRAARTARLVEANLANPDRLTASRPSRPRRIMLRCMRIQGAGTQAKAIHPGPETITDRLPGSAAVEAAMRHAAMVAWVPTAMV